MRIAHALLVDLNDTEVMADRYLMVDPTLSRPTAAQLAGRCVRKRVGGNPTLDTLPFDRPTENYGNYKAKISPFRVEKMSSPA
ncbi:hypothetical protein [Halorubrum yunnanense]|uniref:Uncharacterized protein n=1 Tax=Halorubrum yunnanense TaxID=1526162 RepID=A0ABD5YG19_9EURY|nr:hypothetical protein [Halorubrum yunnanense]